MSWGLPDTAAWSMSAMAEGTSARCAPCSDKPDVCASHTAHLKAASGPICDTLPEHDVLRTCPPQGHLLVC